MPDIIKLGRGLNRSIPLKRRRVTVPPFGTTDIIRDAILVMDSSVVIYTSLFGLVLLAKWFHSPVKRWTDATFSWALFMFGMALNSFFFILSDFVFTTEPLLSITTRLGYLFIMIALLALFLAMERIVPYLPRNRVSAFGLIITIVTIFIPYEMLTVMALLSSLTTLLVLCVFLIYAIRNTTGGVRHSMELIFISFFIGFLGFVGRSDFAYYNLGQGVYTFAALLLVIGLVIMGVTVIYAPSLDELDWYNQMVELYVIHYSGLLLVHHSFKKSAMANEDLTAAGVTGIQAMFKEILNSPAGFSSISIGSLHILFDHGKGFTTVLIVQQPYRILFDKIREFTQQFEIMYSDALERNFVNAVDIDRATRAVEEAFREK